MSKGEQTKFLSLLDMLTKLCDDAKCLHESFLRFLPHDEKENHEVWFKANMIPNNEFISGVDKWVSQTSISKNDDDDNDDDGVNPADSVSNVSEHSQRSVNSSITSSVKLKAAAERASVLAHVKAVKKRHAIEEEEEKLRKIKEMFAL